MWKEVEKIIPIEEGVYGGENQSTNIAGLSFSDTRHGSELGKGNGNFFVTDMHH